MIHFRQSQLIFVESIEIADREIDVSTSNSTMFLSFLVLYIFLPSLEESARERVRERERRKKKNASSFSLGDDILINERIFELKYIFKKDKLTNK